MNAFVAKFFMFWIENAFGSSATPYPQLRPKSPPPIFKNPKTICFLFIIPITWLLLMPSPQLPFFHILNKVI